MIICRFCEHPVTEKDLEDGDYCDTELGEVHNSCLVEWQEDAEYRRGDEECDRMRGT